MPEGKQSQREGKSEEIATNVGGHEAAPTGPPGQQAQASEEADARTPEEQLNDLEQPLHSTHGEVKPKDEE